MSWFKCLAIAGLFVADASLALAADMPGAYPMPVLKAPPYIDLTYGWYMRGDLGYAWGTVGDAQSAPGYANPTSNKLGSGFVGGIGAGIKSRWLRTGLGDATYENVKKQQEENTPLKHAGTPEDMAGIAIYLASRAGDYVIGNSIAVDGGIVYANLSLPVAGE